MQHMSENDIFLKPSADNLNATIVDTNATGSQIAQLTTLSCCDVTL